MKEREAKKLVWVNDWWCPSYMRNGKIYRTDAERKASENKGAVWVTVSIVPGYGEYQDSAHVSAWGGDDLGVDIWFDGTEQEITNKYNEWVDKYITNIPKCVNMRWFLDHGFSTV